MIKRENLEDLKNKLVLTDSRYVSRASSSVFFAIKGERHDGHQFIQELYEKGVRDFVVLDSWFEKVGDIKNLAKARFYTSRDVLESLQLYAAKHRESFAYPVIGITGSNGKTIVKEWIDALLKPTFNIVKSPRSYNSQVGVPLSVLRMSKEHELGVFEAGISLPAEMQKLEKVIKPRVGVFTNIGPAHDEGFKSTKQKVTEKLQLFRGVEVLIYCSDYVEIEEEVHLFLKFIKPAIQLVAWSRKGIGSFPVKAKKGEKSTFLSMHIEQQEFAVELPFIDEASIENTVHALFASIEVLRLQGWTPERMIPFLYKAVKTLKPVAMRLELKQGVFDSFLIDDTYNNDLGGLEMALNFMDQHHTTREKVLIVSDVLQSGMPGEELYAHIGRLISEHGVKTVYGVGAEIIKYSAYFNDFVAYTSTEELLAAFEKKPIKSKLILIKGARSFGFERVVNVLQQKVHGTKLEINLDAITHNLNFYRAKLNPETKIMAMVKASAYGSGGGELVSLLQYHRVDYLGVAYADEGVDLRRNGIDTPIMVLNPQEETFGHLLQYKLEPEIYSLELAHSFINFVQQQSEANPIKVHLKIDTGMHRLGLIKEELPELLGLLQSTPSIQVVSVFSHLAAADSASHRAFTMAQKTYLEDCRTILNKELARKPLYHIANTAAILRYPEFQMDMVRLGIGLYGVESNGIEQDRLASVTSLTTYISQIKEIPAGDSIGYSRSGMAKKPLRIATIAIGYADGFPRKLGNGNGHVVIKGVKCPVVGNVCMDMTMIAIDEVNCTVGDRVTIFGKEHSLLFFAQQCDTIPYEILTGIGNRVKRVFYKE